MMKYVSKVRNLTVTQQYNVLSSESNKKKLENAFACFLSFHFSSDLFLTVFYRRYNHDGLKTWKKKIGLSSACKHCNTHNHHFFPQNTQQNSCTIKSNTWNLNPGMMH